MATRKTAELSLPEIAVPAGLFKRMVDMSGAIAALIIRDAGPREFLRRLSDPFWFQAFGCVLGFDWHSSDITTTVCAAIKETSRRREPDLGIVVCGGKGATSRKTLEDIRRACDRTGDAADPLFYASRLAVKVDNSAVQDGYQLYHHTFFFVPGENCWSIVQQGMNSGKRHARRYHWLSDRMRSFVSDPHAAVACDRRGQVLNLVAGEASRHRQAITALARENPERILREIEPFLKKPMMPLLDVRFPPKKLAPPNMRMPARTSLSTKDLQPGVLRKVLLKTFECQASEFEQLLGEAGLGPQALRSLSLIAELIYEAPACRRDPAAYSFAHGGKDGQPYTSNRPLYDTNLDRLRQAIQGAKIGQTEKAEGLRALTKFTTRLGDPSRVRG